MTERSPMGDFGEATLMSPDGARIGRATYRQGPTGVLMQVEVERLTPGWHGMHIHAVGDCSDPAFQSAGGHVSHGDGAHGLLNPGGPEAGDLPNLWVGGDGRGRAEIFTDRVRLAASGPGAPLWDADGSALVIHAQPDDHQSQPIGGAGARVACGIMAAG
ncbi:superoxide dismutase family protein [Brevundimonas sp. 2R-24]|uniref:Superoxide dismutase family protein n=1 Tax=Peiella sedimenti TaxID=3061083 RepID=A0ABT8SIY8_9CAUL|nr:superoxide dismutase family protein [Caulobacteraceae bacterium XZ-24]